MWFSEVPTVGGLQKKLFLNPTSRWSLEGSWNI